MDDQSQTNRPAVPQTETPASAIEKLTSSFAAAVDKHGASSFTMGLGTALIVIAATMQADLNGYHLATLTSAEFIVLVLSGVGLLIFGAGYRFMQLRMAAAEATAAAALLERAAQHYLDAADKAGKTLEVAAEKRETQGTLPGGARA